MLRNSNAILARAATAAIFRFAGTWRHIDRRRPASGKKFVSLLAQHLPHFKKFIA